MNGGLNLSTLDNHFNMVAIMTLIRANFKVCKVRELLIEPNYPFCFKFVVFNISNNVTRHLTTWQKPIGMAY